MRFLFVAAFTPVPDSGTAGTLLSIGAALERLGHSVDYAWEPRVPAHIPHGTASRLVELPRRQLRQVASRLTRQAYDVVIVSQPFAYLVYERLAPRYPSTLFLNRTHGWEARLYDAQATLGFGDPQGAGRRLLSHISAAMMRRACARTTRSCHGVLAAARRCGEYVRERYRLPPERVAVIPYGLSGTPRAPAAGWANRLPGRRLLFVGNYLRIKGVHILELLLPELAREFPDSMLTFVVDSAMHFAVHQHYGAAFGDRLTVMDWMPRERLYSIYARHDVLLFPSLFEGFGKAWMEAMAAGMCVVGFGEGGLPDVARNGEDALFCPPGDVSALRTLLHTALDNPGNTAKLGRHARERVRRYTWERTAEETVEWCRRLGAR